ncbi:putative molybdenum carrier protein [uncultured Sunxiuqinia sp.]|uniref:putative molybdenum carrier protein n=1 Tax=uncultured Sunxiuqinia sp. TaxID=1573825 RepID=UPI002AA787C4|nr:putative molybdenum carrier protein [uncultured Sunxiuqinia sp.]
MICNKIISGGQTGVDRAALDACLNAKFSCGGWCPAGRKAEDGEIPLTYPLQEIWSTSYDDRTRKNINESDATLIVYEEKLSGGTLLTYNYASEKNKPIFLFKVSPFLIDETLEQLFHFLKINQVETLNIAGARASMWDKAYELSYLITAKLIQKINSPT